ncbi:MAG: hypothetical protein JWM86_2854 [Thermoleophilia bacterium]|nr:hypothetical protein [Thermoleophilia bacterium]
MADPRVSIVVPTWDRPQLLHRALASVATQEGIELDRIEVLVVDDGGAVDPSAIVAHVAHAAPGLALRVERHPINRGRSASRNSGLRLAAAPHVLFLDDDDLLHPAHLATLLAAIDGSDDDALVPYVGAEQVLEDHDGRVHRRAPHDDGGEFNERMLWLRNLFPIHAALVPTALVRAVGGFAEDLEVLEDWDLWLRLLPRVGYERLDAVTCEFRHRAGADNSVSRERAHHIRAIAEMYERHPLPDSPERDALQAMRERIVADTTSALDAAWTYDRSILMTIDDGADLAAVHDQLGQLADTQDAIGGTWEVILGAPRTEPVQAALVGVEGDVVVIWHDIGADAPAERELHDALRRRATGRTITTAPGRD